MYLPSVINTSDSLGPSFEGQQIPLKLSWAITIHKSQGLTLKQAAIDFGQSERSPGLAYVALSRVKQLCDVALEPVTLDRLQAVKNSSGFKFRIEEGKRLAELAAKTLQLYS